MGGCTWVCAHMCVRVCARVVCVVCVVYARGCVHMRGECVCVAAVSRSLLFSSSVVRSRLLFPSIKIITKRKTVYQMD